MSKPSNTNLARQAAQAILDAQDQLTKLREQFTKLQDQLEGDEMPWAVQLVKAVNQDPSLNKDPLVSKALDRAQRLVNTLLIILWAVLHNVFLSYLRHDRLTEENLNASTTNVQTAINLIKKLATDPNSGWATLKTDLKTFQGILKGAGPGKTGLKSIIGAFTLVYAQLARLIPETTAKVGLMQARGLADFLRNVGSDETGLDGLATVAGGLNVLLKQLNEDDPTVDWRKVRPIGVEIVKTGDDHLKFTMAATKLSHALNELKSQ